MNNINNQINRYHYYLSAVLLVTPSAAIQAQSEDRSVATMLEEVIVTAQKREENLQDTPISISTFDPAGLQRLGVS